MSTNTKANTKVTPQMSVAQYISGAISLSGKTQRTIAEDLGYDNPNILTLFKQGKTKLPINKVPAMAKSLGVDPVKLIRLVMREYMPDTWDVLDDLIGASLVSAEDRALLKVVDAATGGLGFDPDDKQLQNDVRTAFTAHAARHKERSAKAADSVKRGRPKA
jgi:hypothetical protein